MIDDIESESESSTTAKGKKVIKEEETKKESWADIVLKEEEEGKQENTEEEEEDKVEPGEIVVDESARDGFPIDYSSVYMQRLQELGEGELWTPSKIRDNLTCSPDSIDHRTPEEYENHLHRYVLSRTLYESQRKYYDEIWRMHGEALVCPPIPLTRPSFIRIRVPPLPFEFLSGIKNQQDRMARQAKMSNLPTSHTSASSANPAAAGVPPGWTQPKKVASRGGAKV